MDQRVKPKPLAHVLSMQSNITDGQVAASVEEQKHTSRSVTAEPVYPEPKEEMIVRLTSANGVAECSELTFKLDADFRAGSYILLIKDVTPGLPARMQMKHIRILVKLVDLDPPPEEEQAANSKGKPG